MSGVVERVREIVLERCAEHKEKYGYDFWGEHVSYVVREALGLAEKFEADVEIVELGALLHDIALVMKVGERAEHNERGAEIAREILSNLDYPSDRKDRVLGCVLHHRSSKNAENIEETCVADADILAHFDNIPMIFNYAFTVSNTKLEDKESFIHYFKEDFNDLSERTREEFRERFENIMEVLFVGVDWREVS